MATEAKPAQRAMISDDDLADIKGSDSIELKLTIPENDQLATARKLGIDPLNAQIRQVFFFDTPDLTLNKAGVVVRARRSQGRDDDSTVKLRPVVPSSLSSKLRKMDTFKVEVDAMPGGHVCSGSLSSIMKPTAVRSVHLGDRSISKLFSPEQIAYYKEHAPAGIDLDDLTLLGPIIVFKLKSIPAGFNQKLTTEMWMYPDNTRVLELSTKTIPGNGFQLAMELRNLLYERGIHGSEEPTTKTSKALSFFSEKARQAAKESAKASAEDRDASA